MTPTSFNSEIFCYQTLEELWATNTGLIKATRTIIQMVIDLRQKHQDLICGNPQVGTLKEADHVQIRDQATAIIGSRMEQDAVLCSTAYSVVRAGGGLFDRTTRVGVDLMCS